MRKHDRTDVLVVGAGPVGMFAALQLAESGIGVQLIDQEERTAGRSYACALHPRSLRLLDEAGIARDAIKFGHRIESIAFYDGAIRRAELKLSRLPVEFPFVLVLRQSILEDLLEQKLKEYGGLKVQWHHRLADLEMREAGADAQIDELAMTGQGYATPEFILGVKRSDTIHAEFVVGADGQNSVVRSRLGIESDTIGNPQHFAVYEIETDKPIPPEMRVVFHRRTISVLWPLAENRCRWSFQVIQSEAATDFPQKDRSRFLVAEPAGADDHRHQLGQFLSERAPWFNAGIKEVGWATDIEFDHRLVKHFGRNQAWLAGDAAHQTGPVGMQSMNMGLREGADLVVKLRRILRGDGPTGLLDTYDAEYRAEWEQLLGLAESPAVSAATEPWVRENGARLPGCIPASGLELILLLRQLGLELEHPVPSMNIA